MLIKTQLRLTALLPAVFVLLIGSGLWASWIKIDQVRGDAEIAEKTLRVNFELNILTQEYLLYGGARVESQLRIRHQSMGELLAQLKYDNIEEQELIDALRHGHQELGSIYNLLLESKAAAREQLAGALLVTAQGIRAKTRQYADIQHRQVVELQRRADIIIMATLIILAVCSIALLTLLTRRLMQGINELGAGVLQVEAGNLQYNIPISSANELGALAQTFNGMSRKLRDSYTSIDALNNEITERKQAEEALRASESRFRQMTNSLPQLVFTCETDGPCDFLSQQWVAFTGIPEAQQLGYGWLEQLHPDDKAHTVAAWQAAAASGGDFHVEFRIRRHDGEYHWFDTRAVRLRDAAGRNVKWFGSNTDITERKLMEQEIRQLNAELEERVQRRTAELEAANKELEAANTDLEGFSYSVSHDLRAPLRAIDGFAGILRDDYAPKLDDEGRRLFQVVSDNAQKMGRLIDDILAFSRAGRFELHLITLDMNALVQQVWQELEPQRAGRAIEFRLALLPSASGDPAAVRQVLQNLLANAVKFTRECEPAVIEVESHREGEENIYSIRDNGVGFDMAYINKLFGLFQRLHGMEEFEGTGVGLAIVKRFIMKHGGRVWAEGKTGKGATFWFTLPAERKD